MFEVLTKLACGLNDKGQPLLDGIPSRIPKLTSEVFLLIEIAVPVLLVIMGTIDLFKGITADKEDEMVKGRKLFMKRLITGALVFFILAITKLVLSIFDEKNSARIMNCVNCFVTDEGCSSDVSDTGTWKCTIPIEGEAYVATLTVYSNGNVTLDKRSGESDARFSNSFTPSGKGSCPSSNDYKMTRTLDYNTHTVNYRLTRR